MLSDIHGVAGPYARALDAARREGFDRLLILGDLLTYGVDPAEVLDLTNDALARDDAILIGGNHDAIYRSAERGAGSYYATMPGWVRESVDWTCARLRSDEPLRGLPLRDEWTAGPFLAAHANPHGAGDWGYVASPDEMDRAREALAARGFRWGVVGHTHRFRAFDDGPVKLWTMASIGQPRDRNDRPPHWAMIEMSDDAIDVSPRPIEHDWSSHVAAIRATSMSEPTKARLCGFFQ